jgi:hypothetical protein
MNLRNRKIGAYQIAPGIVRIKTHSQFYAEKLASVKGARYFKRAVKEIDGLPYFFLAEFEFKHSLAWAEKLITKITTPTPPPNNFAKAIPDRRGEL